jgi:hypothetical protein
MSALCGTLLAGYSSATAPSALDSGGDAARVQSHDLEPVPPLASPSIRGTSDGPRAIARIEDLVGPSQRTCTFVERVVTANSPDADTHVLVC